MYIDIASVPGDYTVNKGFTVYGPSRERVVTFVWDYNDYSPDVRLLCIHAMLLLVSRKIINVLL